MNLSRLVAEVGPMVVDHLLDNSRPQLAADAPHDLLVQLQQQREEQRALMLRVVDGLADTLQAQEHRQESVGRAKFLTDLAVHLIHGQGEVTNEQARQAVDTAKVMLDRALELTGKD